MTSHEHPRAIGGRLLAPPMKALLALFGAAAVVMVHRFVVGIGPVSNMTDGFTWGIWEPVNVVVFTGIGAGALGVGVLTYALNRGEYHGLVRPAVLLGAICYTLGGSSIVVALGRYWNALALPILSFWNVESALLEVSVCVTTYVCVLWLEVLPSVLEGAAASASPRWSRIGRRWAPRLARIMPYLVTLAIVLPLMHQSSLGGLMLIAESKVHPLWHTALLPLLFLVSCLSMGYAAIVLLVSILRLEWNAKQDPGLFARMTRLNGWILLVYVALRVGDLAWSGKLQLLRLDFFGLLLAFELLMFLVPAVLSLLPPVQRNRGRMLAAALLAGTAGTLYRVDTYLTVYRPGPGWDYFPSIGEMAVTVGMAAIGVAAFILVCRLFPVIVVEERARPERADRPLDLAAGGSPRSETP